MRKNLNQRDKHYLEKMTSNKQLMVISIIIAVVVGRNEILSFLQSFSEGVSSILNSLPSILILVILVLLIIILGKKRT